MKVSILILIFALGVSPYAKSENLKGQIFWPEIGKNVKYTFNTINGEFTYDVRPFIDIKLNLEKPDVKNAKCGELSEFINGAGGDLPLKHYIMEPVSTSLQLFNLPDDKLFAERITKHVGAKAEKFGHLVNKSTVSVNTLTAKITWDSQSLSLKAGPHIAQTAESGLNRVFTGLELRENLDANGKTQLNINLKPLFCDLAEKKMSIQLNYVGYQFVDEWSPSLIRETDIYNINQSLIVQKNKLKNSANSSMLKAANASGLLAFEMAKLGYNSNLIQSGEFVRVFETLFPINYSEPTRLNNSDIEKLIYSLGTVKTDGTDIVINKELNVEVQ